MREIVFLGFVCLFIVIVFEIKDYIYNSLGFDQSIRAQKQ